MTSAGPHRARGARPLAVEGFFQSVAQGIGDTYLSALMVWLGAGPVVLGVIATLPTAATAVSQVVAARVLGAARGVRRFIASTWVLQGVALAAVGAFALLPAEAAIPLAFAGAVAAWSLGGLSVPAWTSLVAATVARPEHGRFFGLRGATQQLGVVVAIVGGGLLLSVTAGANRAWLGFVLVFGLAGLSRVAGTSLLLGVPDRARPRARPRAPALSAAFGASAKFRRLAVYLWSVHFAAWVGAPFFLPYMLDDLGLDYATVGLVTATPAVAKALTLRWWGTVADRVGPGPLLRAMGWCIVPASGLWLVSDSLWWIVAIQIYGGLVWGALELAMASSLLQTTRGREELVASFNLVDGGAMILGSLAGGAIVMVVNRWVGIGFLAAIAATTVLRALAAMLLLGRVRKIGRPAFSHRALPLRMWGVRVARGATFRPWGELPPEGQAPDEGP